MPNHCWKPFIIKQKLCSLNAQLQLLFSHQVFNEPNSAPYFAVERYNVSMPDDITKGGFVVHVSAEDSDPGPYGKVSYRIVNDSLGE